MGRRLTPHAVLKICSRLWRSAGVKSFSPHDLRRSYITKLRRLGVDFATIAKLVGHASIQTTARYDMGGENDKQCAAELLHVPYVPAAKTTQGGAPR